MKEIKLKYSSGSTNNNPEIKRMFDISYLFMDIVIDMMIKTKYIKSSFDEISNKEFQKVVSINQTLWNNIFTSEERNSFDYMNQDKIEKIFKEKLNNINFEEIYKNPEATKDISIIEKSGIDKKFKKEISEYYLSIIDRLKNEGRKVKLEEKEINEIIEKFEKYENIEKILLSIYEKVLKNNNIINNGSLNKMNSLVRELQALENYKITENNGKVTCFEFFTVIDMRDFYSSSIPKNKEEYFKLILDTHREIDNMIELHEKEVENFNHKLLNLYSDKSVQNIDYIVKISYEFKSILHHLFDWYAKVSPETIYKKDAEKLAVISFLIYSKIIENLSNKKIDILHRFELDFLSQFGGWKNISNLSSITDTAFTNFVNLFIGDIQLMIPNDITLSKSWEKKWIKIGGYIEKFEK